MNHNDFEFMLMESWDNKYTATPITVHRATEMFGFGVVTTVMSSLSGIITVPGETLPYGVLKLNDRYSLMIRKRVRPAMDTEPSVTITATHPYIK